MSERTDQLLEAILAELKTMNKRTTSQLDKATERTDQVDKMMGSVMEMLQGGLNVK